MKIWDSYDVLSALRDSFPDAKIQLNDIKYVCGKRKWFTGSFYYNFLYWLKINGLEQWVAEKKDCDEFALFYHAFAKACHAKSYKGSPAGFAVGDLLYVTREDPATGLSGGGHAVNWIAYPSDKYNRLEIAVIEPQNGQIKNLTKKEKESAWFVYA